MKVTENEVKETVKMLFDDGIDYNVHVGTERDGGMVAVAAMMVIGHEFTQAFNIAVIGLAKKHGETYTPHVMGKEMFKRYKAYSGFVEIEKKKPFPISVQWQDNGAVVTTEIWSVFVTDKELSIFCLIALGEIEMRKGH